MNAPLLPGRIEHWSIARLKPYARNAKTHDADQVAKIAASMAEFGWTVPVLVAADGELIAGHGRILAAAHLGLFVALPDEHFTTPEIIKQVAAILFEEEEFRDGFQLAALRDRLGTSRKFVLLFLEYFDAQGVTIRKGDVRTLGRRPLSS